MPAVDRIGRGTHNTTKWTWTWITEISLRYILLQQFNKMAVWIMPPIIWLEKCKINYSKIQLQTLNCKQKTIQNQKSTSMTAGGVLRINTRERYMTESQDAGAEIAHYSTVCAWKSSSGIYYSWRVTFMCMHQLLSNRRL